MVILTYFYFILGERLSWFWYHLNDIQNYNLKNDKNNINKQVVNDRN